MDDTADTPVQATTTSMTVLEAVLASGPATLTEITNGLSLSKSSVHNHLTTLAHLGLVVKRDGRYRVGLRFLEVGATARDQSPFYAVGRPEVDRLAEASGLAAGLVVLERGRAICLYARDGQRVDTAAIQQGDVLPLHASAPGKAILGEVPTAELDRLCDTLAFEPLTDNTHTGEASLRTELETVRTRGVASDREEWRKGVRGLAAGFADDGGTSYGSIYVASDAESMSGKQFQQDIPGLLVSSANRIRQELGSH